ncbi:tumor necrosis factor receptor superfamily member 10A-like isoform X2 [Rhea pennata]|uniref:tumor necrosis factor receptor superfamily member 10A-like isoform X2 n=1 Tax=Rhea pennata TaxID=8795 RepID=UPI002E272D3C
MRGAPRRRCPLLLLSLSEAFWGTVAIALNKRDRLDHLDLSTGREDFYWVQDGYHYCKKCPAGTYIAEHCKVQNGSSSCLPCKEDEYTEYPNAFSKCLGCLTCREDQVQLSPCKATKNTQCACKNGTFCSPDHPCEMCQKCQARCPEGEVERDPCTPHSDLQCGPPTDASPGSQKSMIVIFVVVLFTAMLLAFCLWKCCCKHHSHGGDGRDLRRKSSSVMEAVPRISCPGVNARRKLVPVQGDSVTLLRRSFDIFAREVPYKDWKRYGRALDLLENDIALAEMNDKYSLEPFFQMLNTWLNRQGMKASVNVLLETLDRIELGGVAGDIAFRLVQQGFYQYEELS